MTFALRKEEESTADLPTLSFNLPSFGETFAAQRQADAISQDSWNLSARRRNAAIDALADVLGPEFSGGLAPYDRTTRGRDAQDARLRALTEEVARRRATEAVGPWQDLPATTEEFDQRLIEDMRGEYLDAAETAAQGSPVASFLGSLAAGAADESTVLTLPIGAFGRSTSILRIAGIEAGAGMAAEAMTLPRQFAVADELDLPPPNPLAQLAFSAGISGALGAAGASLARAYELRTTRRQADQETSPTTGDPVASAQEDAAVSATVGGRNVPDSQDAATDGAAPDGRLSAPQEPPASSPAAQGPSTDFEIVSAIIGVESSNNPRAANPRSTARGLGQFIESTWLAVLAKHRPELLQGRSRQDVLDMRFSGALSREMTLALLRDNRAALQEAGIATDAGTDYLAHFLGSRGAIRVLRAPGDTPIARLVSRGVLSANAPISYGGKRFSAFTVDDLRAWSNAKMRGAPTGPVGSGPAVTSRPFTSRGEVLVGENTRVAVTYEVADLGRLRQAAGDLQPRDRTRAASDAWVADTAARLDPAQLMPAPTADRGAPLVGPDSIIESGNGRVRAIAQAYERFPDRADAYRAEIAAQGFDVPAEIERPVLIARRRTELDDQARRSLVIEAQDSGVARMTATERARAGAQALTPDRLARLDRGFALTTPQNRGFVRDVLNAFPRSERNALLGDGGAVSGEGSRQIRESLVARAFDDPAMLESLLERAPGPMRGLYDALEDAAPALAQLRAEIEAGRVVPDMDITPHITEAVELIGQARALSDAKHPAGKVLEELLADEDLFIGGIAPLTQALARKFMPDGRQASAKAISKFLTRYADEARKAGRAGQALDPAGPLDVLKAIDAKTFGDLTEAGAVRARASSDIDMDAMPDGAFDDGALSEEAQAAIDAFAAISADEAGPDDAGPALRAALEGREDMTLELDDGTAISAREILEDLDDDGALDTVIDLCTAKGPR